MPMSARGGAAVPFTRVILRDQVRDLLLSRVVSGEYPPGSRLVETRIAAELGVSQAPVREALRDQGAAVRRIVDLSMPVHMDMLTFPRVPPPALTVYESHEDFATRIGAAEYGIDSLTASYLVVQNDHVGTHLDARKHIVPTAGGPETIPLEYCISDGVLLDFTDKEPGYIITTEDVRPSSTGSSTRSRSATSSSTTREPAPTTPRSATGPTTRA